VPLALVLQAQQEPQALLDQQDLLEQQALIAPLQALQGLLEPLVALVLQEVLGQLVQQAQIQP